MQLNLYHSKLAETLRGRNRVVAIAVMLLGTVLIQAMVIFYLAGRERVVLVPPQLEKSVWLKGDLVSRTYLEQMSLFFASLALNTTPENAGFMHQKLLRFVDPKSYGQLKTHLIKEADILKGRNIATVFNPVALEIDENNLSVDISGDLVTLVGKTETSSVRKTYHTQFINRNGQWFVSEFRELQNEKETS